jgi:NADPH-dependent F420 reductase
VSAAPKLGFLGGTGIEGKGLALRFALAGAPVIIGSRSAERAQQKAAEYNALLGRGLITGAENREMLSRAEMVFLTTPFAQATDALLTYRDAFRPDQVLVDVTVPVKTKSSPGPGDLAEGSGSQHLAAHLPDGFPLVGAFKTVPSHVLAELQEPLECDILVCGDSEEAKARVMEVIRLIPTLRPVDAGRLSVAGTLEQMTALAIGINRRYKIKTARFRVVGL